MEEIRECPRCHMPTLPDQEHLQHYLWCPDHDAATCISCRDEVTDGAYEAPGAPRKPVKVSLVRIPLLGFRRRPVPPTDRERRSSRVGG